MKRKIHSSLYRQNSGVILLMVLGLLMVLSLLVTHFLKEVLTDIHYRSQIYGDTELKTRAYDGLEISLAALHEINILYNGIFSPEQGWEDPLAYANIHFPSEIQIRVKITDETGKISLQKPDKRCFEAFCETIGISSAEASSLSHTLINWLKRKATLATLEKLDIKVEASQKNEIQAENPIDGQKENKKQGPKPYLFATHLKAYGDLQNFSNFREAFWNNSKSNDRKLFERFIMGTSLYNSFPININTANNDVLETLGKIYSLNIEDIKSFLKDNSQSSKKPHYYTSLEMLNRLGHGHLKITKAQQTSDQKESPALKDKEHQEPTQQESKSQLSPIAPLGIDVRCQVLRIQSEAKKGDVSFVLTAIVKVNRPTTERSKEDRNKSVKGHLTQKDKNLTSRTNTNYNTTAASSTIQIIGLTENGQIDW